MVDHIAKTRKMFKSEKPAKDGGFYSSAPKVPDKKLASHALSQNASLGNNTPGMVPHNQGQTSGLGLGAPQKRPTHGFGHSVALKVGPLRMSGAKGAHRVGNAGVSKPTIR